MATECVFFLERVISTNTNRGRYLQLKPFKPRARCFASAVDNIEASLQNQLKETHSIESLIQKESSEAVPQINDQRHTTVDPLNEKIAGLTQVQIWEIRRRHSMLFLPDSSLPSSIH